jgi:inosose dehydratase
MKLGYQTNTWGGVFGHPAGVTSVKDLVYLAPGATEQAVVEIAAAGYQGFELFDGNLVAYEQRKDAFRSLLQETGLKLLAVYCGANFIYPDILPDELWRINRASAMASELGAKHLVVGGGAIRAAGIRDDDYAWLADSLNQVMDIAQKNGLIANYHPHHGTIVATPEQITKIFTKTSIGFCPDTGHILEAGGDPIEMIRTYGNRIPYIHLKDYGNGGFLPLGQGQVDVRGVVEALQAVGYDGWITVELDMYAGPPKEAAEIAIRFLEQQGLLYQ